MAPEPDISRVVRLPESLRANAAELVALAPDVILAAGSSALGTLLRAARTVPIVFASAADPVGGGFVASLARPGGNATEFALFEYGLGVKWLELLKQIAPQMTRVAVLRNPSVVSGADSWAPSRPWRRRWESS